MIKYLWVLFLVLSWTSMSLADLEVEGDQKVGLHKLVRLKAVGSDAKGAGLIWDITTIKGIGEADREELDDGRLVFTGPPGTYEIRLTAVNFDTKKIFRKTLRVTIEGESPIPIPPDPKPVPPDPKPLPPVPVLAKAWVVIVEETNEATGKRGEFLNNKLLQDFIRAKQWKVRIADKDGRDKDGNFPNDVRPWLKRAEGRPLPQFFLIDEKGRVRHEGKLPPSPLQLLEELKRASGGPQAIKEISEDIQKVLDLLEEIRRSDP